MKDIFLAEAAAAILLVSGLHTTLFSMTGPEVLDKVEAVITSPTDMQATYEMVLGSSDNSGGQEKRTLRIWSMGEDRRVVKFITPASINNVGVLALSDDEMYVYLPAYQKSRRIQGDMRDQDFQGTDFSYREMGSYKYTKDFDAEVAKEDENTIILNLTRKAGSDYPYDKLIMMVDKSNYLPKTINMFAGSIEKKRLTILDSERVGEYWTFKKIRMDNLETHHFTEISMKDIKFDQDLQGKNVFTLRFLKEYVK